jgi:CheY-like chemotaxis protein/anti-sigma regulatory factor (Ser/Thr protein kinase)
MHSILVVDDCSVDRRLVRGLLCCGGDWDIRFAEDGAAALDAVANDPPDLIITDLQMPRVDGLQLVQELKKLHPDIPVVLISSQGSHDIALQALREGAVFYSPKSALGKDLIPAVRQVLGIVDHVHAAEQRESLPTECAVSFELENDDSLIFRLIEHLQVNLPEWADADRIQIAMALHEAVTNAMHHGNLEVSSDLRNECENKYYEMIQLRRFAIPYCDRRVRIDAEYQTNEVKFRIVDQGPGFDPLSVCDPREDENLERLSGRGLLLIREFMDDVRHNSSGNQITMIKRNRDP